MFAGLSAQEKPSDSTIIKKDFSLANPIRYEAYYDVASGMYYVYPKVGNLVIGEPIAMTSEEYHRYIMSNALGSYYKEKSNNQSLTYRDDTPEAQTHGLLPSVTIKNK